MDLQQLQFRSEILQKTRNFFIKNGYLEVDTPALSPTLIPETCLEVFKTNYVPPNYRTTAKKTELYLVPSPEIYIKKLIAQHQVNMFQLSKCYRNTESIGNLHSPEFTMLEFYTMNADYTQSRAITEQLIVSILSDDYLQNDLETERLRPPFLQMTMDEAFLEFAGFRLSEHSAKKDLFLQAKKLGLFKAGHFTEQDFALDDIYELIFVHCVEPQLAKKGAVFLTDYPAFVPCLAKNVPTVAQHKTLWKERWELYINGMELANCYSEENNAQEVRHYFEQETREKNKTAHVLHAVDANYWKYFTDFPKCSGVALGFDRLLLALQHKKNIESVLPFPLQLE